MSALVAVHVKVATDALTDTQRRVDLDYSLLDIPDSTRRSPMFLRNPNERICVRVLRTNVLDFAYFAPKELLMSGRGLISRNDLTHRPPEG